jgi:hypothetical protein
MPNVKHDGATRYELVRSTAGFSSIGEHDHADFVDKSRMNLIREPLAPTVKKWSVLEEVMTLAMLLFEELENEDKFSRRKHCCLITWTESRLLNLSRKIGG